MDCTRSRYPFVGPCKIESFVSYDHDMSSHQADILDSRYRPPKNEAEPRFAAIGMDVDDKDVAHTTRMKHFRLSDEEAVCKYLYDQLLMLQQQAGKRIAKAWIKAICPKKQARYPYKTKQQKDGHETDAPIRIPEWWPIDLCQFTEPDHLDKKSRMDLCLYLLRLRSSSEQLKKWNPDLQGPNKTLETRGWTAFLQELTPSTTLDGLGKSPESEDRVKQRHKVMNDMYEIAEKEEAFIKGERDDDLIYHEDYEDASTVSGKKSLVKKRGTDARGMRVSNIGSRRQKKTKHAATLEPQKWKRKPARVVKVEMVERRVRTGRGTMSLQKYAGQIDQTRASNPRCKPIKPSQMQMMQPMGTLLVEHPSKLIPNWRSIDNSTTSQENSPQTSSFSSQSSQGDLSNSFQIWDGPTDFPGLRDFKFEESTHQQNGFHVHNVEIPQPYFETVPNTPLVSPSKSTAFSRGSVWPEKYHVAPLMERYPERLSTAYMSAITAPVLPSQPPMLPSDMLFAPGPFINQVDRRSITPASDAQAAYGDYPSIEHGEHQHHSLPVSYHRDHPTPHEDSHPMPFAYPEPTPDANFPAAALPGSVVRGYTGTSSGVGDGAWV